MHRQSASPCRVRRRTRACRSVAGCAEIRAATNRRCAEPWTSDREALAALRTAPAQHEPTALRGHAYAEPVGALAMQVARLERALHRGLRLRFIAPSGGPETARPVSRKMGAEGYAADP